MTATVSPVIDRNVAVKHKGGPTVVELVEGSMVDPGLVEPVEGSEEPGASPPI